MSETGIKLYGYSDDQYNVETLPANYESRLGPSDGEEWGESDRQSYRPMRVLAKSPSGDNVSIYLDFSGDGFEVSIFGLELGKIETWVDSDDEP